VSSIVPAYLETHQFASAESVFHRVLARDSSSYLSYLTLGDAQLGLGRAADAAATFERTVRAFPDNEQVEW
jgi:Tfp pilus assembly protein PilF